MKTEKTKIFPGQEWLDRNGNRVNAHGGGVHCYSSRDLLIWIDEGLVLSVDYDNPMI